MTAGQASAGFAPEKGRGAGSHFGNKYNFIAFPEILLYILGGNP
jgi:hypothetical protein